MPASRLRRSHTDTATAEPEPGPAPSARRAGPSDRNTQYSEHVSQTEIEPFAIILAAGLGTRMKSRVPKVLHPLLGRPMLSWVLDAARDGAGSRRPIVVHSPATDAVRERYADEATLALQSEPIGTGDAVRAGLAALPEDATEVVVMNGDIPLVQGAVVRDLVELRRELGAHVAFATTVTDDPGRLGRVVRDDECEVERIVEAKDATDEELDGNEVNAGLYAFDAAWLRRRIGDLTPSVATGELYLTDLISFAREDGIPAVALLVPDDGALLGVNDRAELADAEARLRMRINSEWMLAGVSMEDPTTVYIDSTVELAQDVRIEPNVILRGQTRIGTGTVLGAGTQIIDSIVGADCRVWASILESSEVEDEVQIGPFAHLRPGASIGRKAKLGNFAEVKKSRIGPGVQQHHFSYIGDAEVGEGTNIGAGTVTANYDGVAKHRTAIGKRVFIGSDSMLIAPLTIGDDARTGAGSVVTKNVAAGVTVVGVPARPTIGGSRHARPAAPAPDRGDGTDPAAEKRP